jgi:capsular exopolysaccharide synthesis family protein
VQEAIDLARQRLGELSPEQRTGAVGDNLQERLNRLELTSSLLTGDAELVQRAIPPNRAASPKTTRNIVFGIVLGGIIGLGLALVRERLDRTIKTEEELERIYGAPVLARLPRSRKLGRTVALQANAPESEAFRILRANLRYFDADARMASVLVTSPVSGDGKSTVARGLAMTMANLGDHVVLVEADLHKRSSILEESPERGLGDVLAGRSLEEALVHVDAGTGGRRLTVLPSGGVPANPSELLESTAMTTLIHELERRFEFVVIDSPALSHVSDVRPIVSLVSGLLIVSALGHTDKRAAADFRKQVDLLEGRALGVVANLAPMPRSGYYY